jgi:hypothetical protein
MLVALFVGALFWNIGTWWFGLPNSSSQTSGHATNASYRGFQNENCIEEKEKPTASSCGSRIRWAAWTEVMIFPFRVRQGVNWNTAPRGSFASAHSRPPWASIDGGGQGAQIGRRRQIGEVVFLLAWGAMFADKPGFVAR